MEQSGMPWGERIILPGSEKVRRHCEKTTDRNCITNEQKKSLNMVLRNTTRLDHLISDIFDISKLESGAMKFIMVRANLIEYIKNAVETMRLKAQEKNIKVNAISWIREC